MARRARRILALAVLVAAIVFLVQRRARTATSSAPSGAVPPTVTDTPDHSAPPDAPVDEVPVEVGARWLPAVDGECPPGHTVKANETSGIFHMPGGRFYQRTIPDRCYATADDATADGYRRSKA